MRVLRVSVPPQTGPEVSALQAELVAQGWLPAEEANGQFDAATAGAVSRFQREHGIAATGEADGGTLRLLANASVRAAAAQPELVVPTPAEPEARPEPVSYATTDDPFQVAKGQITFDAEGMETRGPFFSRVPHVPGSTSGVTIGRGYDLKERAAAGVRAHLEAVGIRPDWVTAFAGGVGKHGADAERYVQAHLRGVEITAVQQKALFLVVYDEMERDVRRICGKADVVARYGATDFAALSDALLTVVVDLRYRGDYHGTSRRRVQPTIVANDLSALRELLSDRDYWMGRFNVPRDRFERRLRFVEAALG